MTQKEGKCSKSTYISNHLVDEGDLSLAVEADHQKYLKLSRVSLRVGELEVKRLVPSDLDQIAIN